MTCNGASKPARKSTSTSHPKDKVPGPAVAEMRWYVTEALVDEHGRTLGCPRCSGGIGIHNAECRGWIDGILLRQSRMNKTQEEEPRSGRTTTKLVPMGSEKPTGPAMQHGGSSGSGVQRNDAASSVVTRSDDEELPEVLDIVMDAEDSCKAQVKRARMIMGLDVCVLEALHDVYEKAAGITTNPTEMCGEYAADEEVAALEVMSRGHVYSQKTETVRGRLVDDVKNDRAKSRFVAAKLARDVKHDVHAGTPALKALRMTINLAAMRDGKHRLRNSVFYDITATFVHASMDEVVGFSPQSGLLEKRECPLVLNALYGTWVASKAVAATLHENVRNARVESEQNDAQFLSTPRSCGNVRMSRKQHHGRRQRRGRASWGILIEGDQYGQPRE